MNDVTPLSDGSSRSSGYAFRPGLLAPAGDRVDGFRRARAALRRRRMLAWVLFIGVLGIVLMLGLTRTKQYTATTNMVVNSRELTVAEKNKDVLPDLPTADNAADTEVEILRSPAVAMGTVKALNLAHNPWFAPKLVKLAPAERDTGAAAIVMASLKVDRPGQSNVVSIAYMAPDPLLAKAVADQVAQQYLAVKERSRRAAVANVNGGMSDEINRLRDQLQQAEDAVAQYRVKHNLFDTQGDSTGQNTQSSTFTQQELSTYKQQEAASRAALADAQARLAAAETQLHRGLNGGGDVGAALQSPVVQQLRNQRAQLATAYADMQARYQPDHPDLIKAKDQLDVLDRAINAEIERQISSLRANLQIARDQEANASRTVAMTSGALASDNTATVQLNELQRKADGLRDTYQTLLTRRNSIASQALVADEDARIVSPAVVPIKPTWPNKPLVLLIGLALAAIVTTASVWLAEAFDRKLVTSDDVERKLGLPHVANVPDVASLRRLGDPKIAAAEYVLKRPDSLYAESLRAIRLTLMRPARGNEMTTVGITSSRPGEGKTTLAISLARVSAMAGSRTLLVDADTRRPMVAKMLGVSPRNGLVELLRGTATLDDVLLRDEASGAMVLPCVRPAGSSTSQDLFDGGRLQALLASLQGRFDLVIFDSAPAMAVADARLLMRQLDQVLLAVRWNDTPRQTAAAALKRMRALDIEPLGAVTTRVNMRALAAYGHGDIDRDHATYGAYYSN